MHAQEDLADMRFNTYVLAVAFAAFIGLLVVQPIRAQALYGALVGNITDATSASIPEAKVKITHVETNQVRETQTNTDGTYSFPTISPGTYEVEISREWFPDRHTASDVPVRINTTVRVDAALPVGAASQSLEVSGETPLLQTDRADVHAELNS